jgi:hypothetical protein
MVARVVYYGFMTLQYRRTTGVVSWLWLGKRIGFCGKEVVDRALEI